MAAKSDEETNGCVFLWKIENISHWWVKKESRIISPAFIADAIDGTKWTLWLYPNCNDNIHLYLHREEDCCGPNIVDVKYQLRILSKDDSSVNVLSESIKFPERTISCSIIALRETVFVAKREAFISEDTLTIQCMIWKKSKIPVKPNHLSARTVFKVNRRSFSWKIAEFSTLKPGVKTKFKDDFIDFDLVLNEGLECGKTLNIDGVLLDKSVKYFLFKTCIIDSEGKKTDSGTHEYFESDLKRGISSTLLFVEKLLEDKHRNLPNDVLSLECEYVSSNGTVLYEVCGCGIISPKTTNVTIEKGNEHRVGKEKNEHPPALVIDMKSMYKDGIFSDMVLRTSTQSFPVHKSILSARSPVFRRMFSSDMKEKNSRHVDITDIDDDTVHRMLLYIYTDSLENLLYESASKLYTAADKYEILSLRNRCSSFLKDSLCLNKACDILVLADLHHDDDLKIAVQDYILKYDKEVFGSKEWKHIMGTNPVLAADTMYRKYFPG
ncbi:TD and POZ domain-containing protein 1 [Argiope bruennichi]|uniref:TD and POZ domain-containing protein 1 n=1 Tax=Argiope bruennichi TaxID=94029 RepID=A0A8T0FEL8_ARGBR|nr:TD and POZ domain-containing protein 1 [Argiope bruennichi]